jgi:hypothetical protein
MGMRDMDRVIAFASFALAAAVVIGIVGLSRPLWASLNSRNSDSTVVSNADKQNEPLAVSTANPD